MKKLFLLAILTLIPNLLFSATNIADNKIIYAWGYGEVVSEILTAVRGVLSDSDYWLKVSAIIGLSFFIVRLAFNDRILPVFELGKISFLIGLIWFLFLHAPDNDRHRFMVHDEVTGQDYIVSRVPLGLGTLLNYTTSLEKFILDGMEKFYSTPQSANYGSAGMHFSLALMDSLPDIRASVIDDLVQTNLNHYHRMCVVYQTEINNQIPLYRNSTNLINDLFDTAGAGSVLTIYETRQGNGTVQEVVECTEAGQRLKNDFNLLTDKAQELHMAMLNYKDKTAYEKNFRAVANVYHQQAQGARAYLQQSMLMYSLRDSTVNTAKMMGLDPNHVAASFSVADQNFIMTMQTQGHLAKRMLPVVKAYVTCIIIGISWIVALLSIAFLNFMQMKMLLILFCWLVFWTPMASILNFLIDLNLMRVSSVINQGADGLNIANNRAILKEVASISSILNYMAILIPTLAFALVKGSEYALVSAFSQLTGASSGAARSAATFSNQQALSTKSEISSSGGENLSRRFAGVEEVIGANTVNGITNTTAYTNTINDDKTSASFKGAYGGGTVAEDGRIINSDVSGVSVMTLNSASKAQTEQYSKAYNDAYNELDSRTKQTIKNETQGYVINANESERRNIADTITNAVKDIDSISDTAKASLNAKLEAYTEASISGGFKIFGSGGSVSAGAKGSFGVSAAKEVAKQHGLTEEQSKSLADTIDRASEKAYLDSLNRGSSQSDTLSHSTSDAVSKVLSTASSYTESLNSSKNISVDSVDNILTGIAKSDYERVTGESWSNASMDDKLKYAQNAVEKLYSYRDDSGELMYFNKMYGANTLAQKQDGLGSTKAVNTRFSDVDASDYTQNLTHNKNIDNVKVPFENEREVSLKPKEDVKRDYEDKKGPTPNNTSIWEHIQR